MKIRQKFTVIFLLVLISSCGFKIVNRSSLSNYQIADISTEGDKRIGYDLKNKVLLSANNTSNKSITINLKIDKNKSIKEKNIKNEITKYAILIDIDVSFELVGSPSKYKFKVSKTSDFGVESQYSQTLNNEKKLIKLMTKGLAKEIVDKLYQKINAI